MATHPWYSCLGDPPTGRFYRLETRFSWCGYSPMVQLPRGPTHWSFLQVRNQVFLVWLLTHGTVASRTHPLVVFTGEKPGFLGVVTPDLQVVSISADNSVRLRHDVCASSRWKKGDRKYKPYHIIQ